MRFRLSLSYYQTEHGRLSWPILLSRGALGLLQCLVSLEAMSPCRSRDSALLNEGGLEMTVRVPKSKLGTRDKAGYIRGRKKLGYEASVWC